MHMVEASGAEVRAIVIGTAALLAVVSGDADAETTRCRNTYVGAPQLGMTCETTGMPEVRGEPPAPRAAPRWQDVPPVACSGLEKLARGAEYCDARAVAAARRKVGEQIAAGECDGALKGALATGDLQFATEVREFCSGVPENR